MSATAAISTSYVLLLLSSLVPFAVVLGPTSDDQFSIAGAAFAALLGGLHSLSHRRPFFHVALVLFSSAGVGTIAPGGTLAVLDVIYPTFAEHLMASMTWHLYAAGGLFWGLGGWAILSAVMRQWDLRADALAQRPFEFLDRRNPEESEDAPPP